MSDETKLPPGWVRLTRIDGGVVDGPVSRCGPVSSAPDAGGCTVAFDGWHIEVREDRAEVLSRIAEAQREQRRFDALPGMAARMVASSAGYGYIDAIEEAGMILDAIEAGGAGEAGEAGR